VSSKIRCCRRSGSRWHRALQTDPPHCFPKEPPRRPGENGRFRTATVQLRCQPAGCLTHPGIPQSKTALTLIPNRMAACVRSRSIRPVSVCNTTAVRHLDRTTTVRTSGLGHCCLVTTRDAPRPLPSPRRLNSTDDHRIGITLGIWNAHACPKNIRKPR